ncbi:MAG: glycosyltransferase family 4 protein [Candidatus Thiodiazotropha taylori]|nr:glycosyltransferase family 4 protein [Candidatus Thiodiazotropha taylori]MCW4291955.1 glycosyltransferase family 4 protein [Candidatus Thiodiazotropha taylori]
MQNKKTIMFCEGNIDGTIGGSYYSLLFLTRGLDRSKYTPVVVFHRDNALIPEYNKAGVRTLVVPSFDPILFQTSKMPLLKPIIKIVQKLANLFGYLFVYGNKYKRLLQENSVDLLHLNNSIIRNNNWIVAALMARVPCITHERGINEHYPAISKFLAKRLKAIISISNSVTERLTDNGVDREQIVTIHNGIDPDDVRLKVSDQDMLQQLKIGDDFNVIGVIGNIKEWKGQEVAVRAMRKVVDAFPKTVCLLIGDTSKEDAYYQERLKSLITELGLESNIIFTGHVKNVPDYLNVLDIMLHTSIDPEPFGRVLIEAMSLSKPLIASNDGAIPEIVEHEKTGLTFTPGDHDHLADSVIRLLQDRDYAEQIGKAGFDRLMDHFHINVNVQKTELLYERILTES